MNRRKFVPLSNDRRIICDLIAIANRMPTAPVQTEIDVTRIKHLRRLTQPRISWQVIMMRAYALVARDMPALRRCYVPFPWPRLYEHHENVCMLTISRNHFGVERLFFARFCQPENHSLLQLQQRFDDYRRLPVSELVQLKHQLRFANMPWLLRKAGLAILTHLTPASRARQMGTFGMSLSGFRQVHGTFHLGPCTTTLGFDQLCRKGKAYVTLTFDHRVLDGKPASDALHALGEVLKNQVANELQMIACANPDIEQECTEIEAPGLGCGIRKLDAKRENPPWNPPLAA